MSAGHGLPSQVKVIMGIIVVSVIFTIFPIDLYRDLPHINTVDLASNSKDRTDYYKVDRVVDGDTIVILMGDKEAKVRLLGINTPESVDPRRPVQCYGKEASAYLESIAEGKYVQLEYDASQGQYDKYDRLLAYVYLEDGQMLNQKMIAEGYAYEYTYNAPYKYTSKFKSAEGIAKYNARGLWSEEACNGKL